MLAGNARIVWNSNLIVVIRWTHQTLFKIQYKIIKTIKLIYCKKISTAGGVGIMLANLNARNFKNSKGYTFEIGNLETSI